MCYFSSVNYIDCTQKFCNITLYVPPITVTVQLLKAEEIAPKGNLTAATAARTLPDDNKKK